ncbi:unnamed protein product [Trichobilharzia szidati]|nr:unnamed protein product [Trichobilharzia szidati]
MTWAMANVYLTITSQTLTVETLENGVLLFQHNLFLVSFASAGDAETLDFICYVAKTDQNTRMCYVFECPGGLAQDVIITIGQAFQLGYQDFKNSKPQNTRNETFSSTKITSSESLFPNHHHHHHHQNVQSKVVTTSENSSDHHHFSPVNSPNKSIFSKTTHQGNSSAVATTSLPKNTGSPTHNNNGNNNNNDLTQSVAFDNFMDFEDNAWLLGNEMSCSNQTESGDYNKSSCSTFTTSVESKTNEVDQQPSKALCNITEIDNKKSDTTKTSVGLSSFEHLEPIGEPWYVGKMSRSQAENLLRYDGDFLVRASIQQPGQFVLSGLQDGKYRHLLLADPNGQVRTKERVFDSIQHLIDYHVQNGAPIRSLDSEIKLIFPVSTHTFCIS